MRRILLDQGLAPRTATLLREKGWDAVQVFEIGLDCEKTLKSSIMPGAKIAFASIPDHDFHSHLALSSAGHPSVVLLRAEGLDSDAQAALLKSIWVHCADALAAGSAVSASLTKVRIRRLPLCDDFISNR